MKIIYKKDDFSFPKKTVVALGNFDGLHIAHKRLIKEAVDLAKEKSIYSLAYIFDRHPMSVLQAQGPKLIIRFQDKLRLLSQLGLDFTYIEEFNKEYAQTEPEDFVEKYLKNKLNAKVVITGFDYRFGNKGKGDINTLKSLCSQYDIEVIAIEKICMGDLTISSTLIRKYLQEGEVKKANQLLGRPYFVTGLVEHGDRQGIVLGYPTANIYMNEELVIPKFGVYASNTHIGDKVYKSITSIGIKPTFESRIDNRVYFETHILDKKNFDLYNQEITVELLDFIREEKKFENKEKLIEAIEKDILLVNEIDE